MGPYIIKGKRYRPLNMQKARAGANLYHRWKYAIGTLIQPRVFTNFPSRTYVPRKPARQKNASTEKKAPCTNVP